MIAHPLRGISWWSTNTGVMTMPTSSSMSAVADSAPTTGLKPGIFYKVPRGQDLPFAGRWLKVDAVHAGAVDLHAAGGNLVRLSNASARRLLEGAEHVSADSPSPDPKAFR